MADIVTKETTTVVGEGKTEGTQTVAGGEKADSSQTAGYIVYFLFGLIDVLLVFRLILKLLGANPGSGFVNFIYALTQLFILPFVGIFSSATSRGLETTAVLESSVLVAIAVYAVLAWGIAQLVIILSGKLQQ